MGNRLFQPNYGDVCMLVQEIIDLIMDQSIDKPIQHVVWELNRLEDDLKKKRKELEQIIKKWKVI